MFCSPMHPFQLFVRVESSMSIARMLLKAKTKNEFNLVVLSKRLHPFPFNVENELEQFVVKHSTSMGIHTFN